MRLVDQAASHRNTHAAAGAFQRSSLASRCSLLPQVAFLPPCSRARRALRAASSTEAGVPAGVAVPGLGAPNCVGARRYSASIVETPHQIHPGFRGQRCVGQTASLISLAQFMNTVENRGSAPRGSLLSFILSLASSKGSSTPSAHDWLAARFTCCRALSPSSANAKDVSQ